MMQYVLDDGLLTGNRFHCVCLVGKKCQTAKSSASIDAIEVSS